MAREYETKRRELEAREAAINAREREMGVYVNDWPPCE
jgi:hypothetical protein